MRILVVFVIVCLAVALAQNQKPADREEQGSSFLEETSVPTENLYIYGFMMGYRTGYKMGYRKGGIAGQKVGYSSGLKEGFGQGRAAGYKTGNSEGYRRGYINGFKRLREKK